MFSSPSNELDYIVKYLPLLSLCFLVLYSHLIFANEFELLGQSFTEASKGVKMDSHPTVCPNLREMQGVYVPQGNENFKTISRGEKKILYTTDLGPCVAVIINDKSTGKIHMIHSDSNERGKGKKTLKDAFSDLKLSRDSSYDISLIGALDQGGLDAKRKFILEVLPHAQFNDQLNAEGAYVLGLTGEISTSKKKFKDIKFKPDPKDPNHQ